MCAALCSLHEKPQHVSPSTFQMFLFDSLRCDDALLCSNFALKAVEEEEENGTRPSKRRSRRAFVSVGICLDV